MGAVLDTPIRVTARDLGRALATRFPVLVVFEKHGSRPCQALAAPLEELAREFLDRVRVIRVEDTDDETAAAYSVVRVPTLVFWAHGREITRIEGVADTAAIREHLDFLVGEKPRPAPAGGPTDPLAGEPSPEAGTPLPEAGPALVAHPLVADELGFEELVLRSPIPVLVDFWAVWCAPCRVMAPIMDDLAREYGGRLRVVKVNTDQVIGWSGRLGIMGIPTFILFEGGREVDRIVGAVPKATLAGAVDRLLQAARR